MLMNKVAGLPIVKKYVKEVTTDHMIVTVVMKTHTLKTCF